MEINPKKFSIRKHDTNSRNPQLNTTVQSKYHHQKTLTPFFNVSFTDYCGLSLRKKLQTQFSNQKNSKNLSPKLSLKNKIKLKTYNKDWLKIAPSQIGPTEWRALENKLKTQHDKAMPLLGNLKVCSEWITKKITELKIFDNPQCHIEANGHHMNLREKKNKKQFRPYTADVHLQNSEPDFRQRRLKTSQQKGRKQSSLLERSFGLRGWEQV